MTSSIRLLFFLCLSGQVLAEPDTSAEDSLPLYDLVVYGSTSAGVTAAVQAAKMDKSVLLINHATHIGGLTSSGLGATDSGKKEVIGGLSNEFYQRIGWYYKNGAIRSDMPSSQTAQWTFEPKVAEAIFVDWLKEYGVTVAHARLDRREGKGVTLHQHRITSITMESGESYRGRMFIDATYVGDLLAAAGVSYVVGREGNAKYNETLNGIQTANTVHHIFTIDGKMGKVPQKMPKENQVDPYMVKGDSESGLLPGINPDAGGEDG